MKSVMRPHILVCLVIAAMLLAPELGWSCATCFGESDAPMARGMNWGILTLLGVIGSVLAGFIAFFVHIGRRSSVVQHESHQTDTHDTH